MGKRMKKDYERNKNKVAEKLGEAMDYLRQELGREPSPEEVAERMETSVETVRKLIGKGNRRTDKAVLVVNNSGLTAGDEVIYDDMRALVCCVQMERFVDILALNGMVFEGVPMFAVTKTGRHFGILREILDIIGQRCHLTQPVRGGRFQARLLLFQHTEHIGNSLTSHLH